MTRPRASRERPMNRASVAASSSDTSRAAAATRRPQMLDTSPTTRTTRLRRPRDPSRAAGTTPCAWCGGPIEADARCDSVFCKKKCRQTAWRLAQRGVPRDARRRPIRVAYADPPYPGCARRYYQSEEVDHARLIAELARDFPDGWALSTSMEALRDVLPLCPETARVCVWVKPHAANVRTSGLHNCCEALIVVGGRQEPPGVRDWLSALPARSGGTLPGRKPIAFCAWLFRCLGLAPGDELRDLFPGTGVVSRAWREASRRSSATRREPSLTPAGRVAARGATS